MRIMLRGMAALGSVLLMSCTAQGPIPLLTESALPSGAVAPEPSEAAPTRPAESPRPSGVSSAESSQGEGDAIPSMEVPQCPPGVELPEGIDSRACGPIPDDAINGQRGERFITPSGNIACRMQEGETMCEARDTVMIRDFHNPEGDGWCNGYWLHGAANHLCHSEPALWDGWDDNPTDWLQLPYETTVFVFEQVCAVEKSGLTCWNADTGHGFFLSRSHYVDW